MNNTVSIYAPLRNFTGYAEVVRNIVKHMYLQGWKINFKEFEKWSSVNVALPEEEEKMFASLEQNKYPSDKLLSFCLPEQSAFSDEKININYTMYEAQRFIPKLWVEASSRLDYIFVPTKHNVRLWNDALDSPHDKIYQCPLGIDNKMVEDVEKYEMIDCETDITLSTEYKYRILVLQELISRKNLAGVLESFYTACVKNPDRGKDTCLVLKINSNSGNKLAQFMDMKDKIKERVEVTYKVDLPRNVFVFSRLIKDSTMYSFIDGFTHYLSMSFGEGWDLTCMKAAALGKQLIVPENTSYLEYLNDDIAHLIPCRQKKYMIQESALVRIYQDSFWDIPDLDAAVSVIMDIDKNEKKNPSNHILENYTWEKSAKRLGQLIDGINFSGSVFAPGKDSLYVRTKTDVKMLACKTLGERCGISEYTKTFHQMFEKTGMKVATVGGDCQRFMDRIIKYKPSLFHLQNEYQFHQIDRMQMFVKWMQRKGIATVLTQHTYNKNTYNYNLFFAENFNSIIVHNKNIIKEYADTFNFQSGINYLPMPVERIGDVSEIKNTDCQALSELNKIDPTHLNLGFFGFCYFHKGIDRLLIYLKNVLEKVDFINRDKIKLYIFSTKPEQDSLGYYEQCQNLIQVFGLENNVCWINVYLELQHLLHGLKKLDYIFLPYDDYGSLGCSAALTTCVQAESPIIYCSSDSPFFDIDDKYGKNIRSISNQDLKEELKILCEAYCSGNKFVSDKDTWDKYFDEHSWERFVCSTQEIYEKALVECQHTIQAIDYQKPNRLP